MPAIDGATISTNFNNYTKLIVFMHLSLPHKLIHISEPFSDPGYETIPCNPVDYCPGRNVEARPEIQVFPMFRNSIVRILITQKLLATELLRKSQERTTWSYFCFEMLDNLLNLVSSCLTKTNILEIQSFNGIKITQGSYS